MAVRIPMIKMAKMYNNELKYCFCIEQGLFAIRLGPYWCKLNAQWNRSLYSERYGYYTFRMPLGFGWRIVVTNTRRENG